MTIRIKPARGKQTDSRSLICRAGVRQRDDLAHDQNTATAQLRFWYGFL